MAFSNQLTKRVKKTLQLFIFLVLAFSARAQSDTKVKADTDTIFDGSNRLVNQRVPSYTAVTIDGKKIDSTYFLNKVTLLHF